MGELSNVDRAASFFGGTDGGSTHRAAGIYLERARDFECGLARDGVSLVSQESCACGTVRGTLDRLGSIQFTYLVPGVDWAELHDNHACILCRPAGVIYWAVGIRARFATSIDSRVLRAADAEFVCFVGVRETGAD